LHLHPSFYFAASSACTPIKDSTWAKATSGENFQERRLTFVEETALNLKQNKGIKQDA